MSLKTISVRAALFTVVTAATTLASVPAMAITLGAGDLFSFGGSNKFSVNTSTGAGQIDFWPYQHTSNGGSFNFTIQGSTNAYSNVGYGLGSVEHASTGGFQSVAGEDFLIKDLFLDPQDDGDPSTLLDHWALASSIEKFIQFSNGVSFTLTKFNLKLIDHSPFNVMTAKDDFEADFEGFFVHTSGDTVRAHGGEYTTQGRILKTNGDSYSGSIEAVPTPALLPGLIGMGLAAMRKQRKQEHHEAA